MSERDGAKGGSQRRRWWKSRANNGEGRGEGGGRRFFRRRRRRWGKTRKVDSTWWSSGPVVVMVPSGGAASDGGGGVEPRCNNRCYGRGGPLSPLHVPSFRLVQVVCTGFLFFSFFSATRPSLHSRGPGNNLWRLLGRGWRLGDEMYLSVFEGRMMSSSGCMNFSHRWIVKSFIFFSFFLSLESLIVSGCKI